MIVALTEKETWVNYTEFDKNKAIEMIAKVAHEVNMAYCKSIGDDTQVSWEDAPDWQKESTIKGVELHLANPDTTPEQTHESWLAQKQADGWKYGEVKNAETKEHPCFRPYSELPIEQRTKDFLFKQVVSSLSSYPFMRHTTKEYVGA